MKKDKNKTITILIIVSVAAMLSVLYCAINYGVIFVKGGPVGPVSDESFEKIEIGMTRKHVESLMGDRVRMSKKDRGGVDILEYGYISGLKQGPSPKAYVIWFKDEKVVKKRRPLK